MSVTVRAPAKVNLVLVVGRPREDGFHPLNTVYQAISLYDDVRVSDAGGWSVSVTPIGEVDCSGVPLDETNIALRAGRLLVDHHGIDTAAHVEISKGIPVAGGLAGGSADAAATLVALDRLWDLRTSDEDLLAIAGSARQRRAVRAHRRHARTAPATASWSSPCTDHGSYWWVVATSDEGLSTPAVYREFDALVPGRARRCAARVTRSAC